jgi:hypothetical protein
LSERNNDAATARVFVAFSLSGRCCLLALFWPWLVANGLNLQLFFSELFSTSIGAFFGADVIISGGRADSILGR